jgi:urea transport system ATP-binding protein
MEEPLLRLDDIVVDFDGFKAIDHLTFAVMPRTVKVLIGPNGAGKSTLLDTVIGKVNPTAGRVIYRGEDITRIPEHKIAQLGIRRKFQAPGVLEGLTVLDNLAVAARRNRNLWGNLWSGLGAEETERVDEVLDLIGLQSQRAAMASALAHGEKQWLEIGMVVVADPELLLLDEPTAGMTEDETAQTAELILRLSRDHTILVIEHDMAFVEQLAAPVSVLHMGRLLKEGSMNQIREDPEVIEVYLGRSKDRAADVN